MFTYLLYSKKTGELIHVHTDEEAGLSADKLFEFVDTEYDRQDIAVVPLREEDNVDRFPVFDMNTQQIRLDVFLDEESSMGGGSIQKSENF